MFTKCGQTQNAGDDASAPGAGGIGAPVPDTADGSGDRGPVASDLSIRADCPSMPQEPGPAADASSSVTEPATHASKSPQKMKKNSTDFP